MSDKFTEYKDKFGNNIRRKCTSGWKRGKPLTISCECCNIEVLIPYAERKKRKYCSKACQIKSVRPKGHKLKNKSLCKICNKEFEHYGERILCSRECTAKYMSQMRLGESNPAWCDSNKINKGTCERCGTTFEYTRANLHIGQVRKFCSLACSRGYDLKSLPRQEYSRQASYPKAFRKIKPEILERDGHKCQMCESTDHLCVHHINYEKSNCDKSNLITLCQKCHNLTNFNRGFWEQLFTGLNTGSKIVKKGWGLEIHIVNSNNYCLKYLIFFKERTFSFHEHILKQELWLCTWGKFEAYIEDDKDKDYFIFKQGDKIEIKPTVKHQLRALTNCIIMEVSTKDYPEDSIKIEKAD